MLRKRNLDIILRYCGAIGWLGIVVDQNSHIEEYRTGKHQPSSEVALNRVQTWIRENAE